MATTTAAAAAAEKKTDFSSIMSQRVVALPDHDGNNKKSKDANTSDGGGGGHREIATGTSHDKSVRSYTAVPKNLPPNLQSEPNTKDAQQSSKTPTEPYKTYSFPLDPFQQQAVGFIEKDESVLVAAHTSAGKTAVAEYAIAKALKLGQRVVYTSPIKVCRSLCCCCVNE